jgi:hypothetical protein
LHGSGRSLGLPGVLGKLGLGRGAEVVDGRIDVGDDPVTVGV